jgi:hypothetical protein
MSALEALDLAGKGLNAFSLLIKQNISPTYTYTDLPLDCSDGI